MPALTSLTPGQTAEILSLDLPSADRTRLMELGLVPGTLIQLERFAPLGDPVEIKLRGYHLSLHRHEADQIQVKSST
jgi:Fe2+ transport system protein FeoA